MISFAKPRNIPFIIQLNKRDIKDVISIEDFKKLLGLPNIDKYPDGTLVVYPATAIQGQNVTICFQDLMIKVISNYFQG